MLCPAPPNLTIKTQWQHQVLPRSSQITQWGSGSSCAHLLPWSFRTKQRTVLVTTHVTCKLLEDKDYVSALCELPQPTLLHNWCSTNICGENT